ncbi:transcription initiation factor TFIID subunit 12 [Cryptomeria japonica]|uniref:transcription initiation factor TFIID subunit 12 n=1 Tax=Cryptomeria japonica TaxID=3369 RepID=UPI0025AC6E14|nr:transcription initiation factor TFIID subunit 12 [Cryptomeria japonica]XP_057838749.1 transcription initiation factor TFIID subunit 12 [Cryptomeria japonica]
MEGESGSSSQQGATNIPSTASLPSSTIPTPTPTQTPATVGASSTIGAPTPTVASTHQNPQQNSVQLGATGVVGVGAGAGQNQQQQSSPTVSSGQQTHQHFVSTSSSFHPGQSRPGAAVNRSRQHPTTFPHLSPSTAMHQQRGGVQMQVMGSPQRPQTLGSSSYGYGMPRGTMMGQTQATSSMIPAGQTDQASNMQSPYAGHQARQKPGSVQVPPYQHPASSGQTLPVPSMSTVGSHPHGSQMRPIGSFSHGQQRPVQGLSRSQTPSQLQPLTQQKMHSPSFQRNTSVGSLGSKAPGISQGGQASVGSSALSNQPQWMPSQGKQMHQSSLPPLASPFQSNLKQQNIQQRSHGQIQQQTLPLTVQQQQPLQEQQTQQFQQQRMSQPLHVASQQHQMSRAAGTPTQNTSISAGTQVGTSVPGNAVPSVSNDRATETTNKILEKRSIQELVDQIDPRQKLDGEVEDILIEIAEDFLERVATSACTMAKHRKSEYLEPKDILLPLERYWHITLPGFSGDEYRTYKRPSVNENHKQRLAVIRKSVATSQTGNETGNAKGSSGQVTGNASAKGTATKGAQEPPATGDHT